MHDCMRKVDPQTVGLIAVGAKRRVTAGSLRLLIVRRLSDLRLGEILDVHQRRLLLEHLRGEVVHVGAAGGEAEVQSLDVHAEVILVLRLCTAALGGQIERAELTELHLLALEELLEDARLELVGHAEADVLSVDGVVLRHVLAEFGIRHRLRRHHTAVVLPEGGAVLVGVLAYFYEYWHFFEIFEVSGLSAHAGTFPDDAKVRHCGRPLTIYDDLRRIMTRYDEIRRDMVGKRASLNGSLNGMSRASCPPSQALPAV